MMVRTTRAALAVGALLFAALLPSVAASREDKPGYQQLRLVQPKGYRADLQMACLPSGDDKLSCRFTETELVKTTRYERGNMVPACGVLAVAWDEVDFSRVADGHWMSQPRNYMQKVGCVFVETLFLKAKGDTLRSWELKQSREFNWSAAECRKALKDSADGCAAIQKECARAQERLSNVRYSGDPDDQAAFTMECPSYIFGGDHWSRTEVPHEPK